MSSENTDKTSTGQTDKSALIQKFKRSEADVGSPEVQIALLTRRIEKLTKHFETHREDKHSRRGMMKLISQRKRLLGFLRGENLERYRNTLSALGLRK